MEYEIDWEKQQQELNAFREASFSSPHNNQEEIPEELARQLGRPIRRRDENETIVGTHQIHDDQTLFPDEILDDRCLITNWQISINEQPREYLSSRNDFMPVDELLAELQRKEENKMISEIEKNQNDQLATLKAILRTREAGHTIGMIIAKSKTEHQPDYKRLAKKLKMYEGILQDPFYPKRKLNITRLIACSRSR